MAGKSRELAVDNLALDIRPIRRGDVEQIHALAEKEGWCLSVHDCYCIYDCHKGDIIAAVNADDKVIGVCGCFKLNLSTGVLGFFITHKDYRRKGIGKKLFQLVLSPSRLQGRNVVLHAAPYLVPTYEASSFKLAALTFKAVEGYPLLIQNEKIEECQRTGCNISFQGTGEVLILKGTSPVVLDLLCEYDRNISQGDCGVFKRAWMSESAHSIIRCAFSHGKPVGLLVIRKQYGKTMFFFLSSLYADNTDIARKLLHQAIHDIPSGARLKCYYPSSNASALKLFEEVGLTEGFPGDYAQPMFSDTDIFQTIEWNKVFSITNFTNAYV